MTDTGGYDNPVDKITAWESGMLDEAGVLTLFGALLADGTIWELSGTYCRAAADLIDGGWLTPTGELTDKSRELLAGVES